MPTERQRFAALTTPSQRLQPFELVVIITVPLLFLCASAYAVNTLIAWTKQTPTNVTLQ